MKKAREFFLRWSVVVHSIENEGDQGSKYGCGDYGQDQKPHLSASLISRGAREK